MERSHRKDNEEFYASHKFFSFHDFQKQLALRQRQYNASPCVPSPGVLLTKSFPILFHIIDKPTFPAGSHQRYVGIAAFLGGST